MLDDKKKQYLMTCFKILQLQSMSQFFFVFLSFYVHGSSQQRISMSIAMCTSSLVKVSFFPLVQKSNTGNP